MRPPKYREGQTVRFIGTSEPEAPFAPSGPYLVLRALPADEFGRWSYRVASIVDRHERAVPERYLRLEASAVATGTGHAKRAGVPVPAMAAAPA